MKDAQQILKEALDDRLSHNSSYSLRAFARDLEISPQQLSNVMNGLRGLGPEAIEKVMKKLNLDDYQRNIFTVSLKAKFSRNKVEKTIATSKLQTLQSLSRVKSLELDLFKVISNWHHMALIELIKLGKKRYDSHKWFASKLDISESETELALERLERLELIQKEGKNWVVNQDTVIADKGISSESIRNYHNQIMEKAIKAMSFQSSEERYGSSSTIPIKVKNVGKAKKIIQDFRIALDQEISDSDQGEEVYGLSIQFFRLTNNKENKYETTG